MYIYAINAIILKNHFQVRGTTVFTDLTEFPYALGLISYTEESWQWEQPCMWLFVFPEMPPNPQPSLLQEHCCSNSSSNHEMSLKALHQGPSLAKEAEHSRQSSPWGEHPAAWTTLSPAGLCPPLSAHTSPVRTTVVANKQGQLPPVSQNNSLLQWNPNYQTSILQEKWWLQKKKTAIIQGQWQTRH